MTPDKLAAILINNILICHKLSQTLRQNQDFISRGTLSAINQAYQTKNNWRLLLNMLIPALRQVGLAMNQSLKDASSKLDPNDFTEVHDAVNRLGARLGGVQPTP